MKWHLRRHVKSKSWGFNQPPRTTVAIVRSGHFGKFWLILWPSACFVLAPEWWQPCPLRQVWGEKFSRFLTMQIYHDLLWQRIILSTCNLQNLFCVYVCTRDQETGHSKISAEKSMSNNIHYANLSTMAPIFPYLSHPSQSEVATAKRSLLSFDNSLGWKCTTCKIQDWCWKFLICWCRELHNTNTSPCSPSTVSWKQTSVDLWHLMSNSFKESRDHAECVTWAILIHYFLRRQFLNERDVLHYNSWKFPKTLDFLNPIAPHWASWLDPHHSHLSASPAAIREEKPQDQLGMQSDLCMLVPNTFASGKLKGCGNKNLHVL